MNRPIPKKFELQEGMRQLRIERHVGKDGWCLWIMANKDFSIGTYILLCDNGEIKRVTITKEGYEHVFDYEENDPQN